MDTKKIVSAYRLTIEADHEQYWQGHGTSFTNYDECATGIGSTTHEALEDCFEMLAQQDVHFTDEQEKDLLEQLGEDADLIQEHCDAKGEHKLVCPECADKQGGPFARCSNCEDTGWVNDPDADCSVCSGEWHYYVSIDVQYATCQCDNELCPHDIADTGAHCENDPTEQVLTDGGRVPMCKGCADFDIDGGRKDGEL